MLEKLIFFLFGVTDINKYIRDLNGPHELKHYLVRIFWEILLKIFCFKNWSNTLNRWAQILEIFWKTQILNKWTYHFSTPRYIFILIFKIKNKLRFFYFYHYTNKILIYILNWNSWDLIIRIILNIFVFFLLKKKVKIKGN